MGSNPTRVDFILLFFFFSSLSGFFLKGSHPSPPTLSQCFLAGFSFHLSLRSALFFTYLSAPGLGPRRAGLGAGNRRGGKVGVDAEIKAGPWLGDTRGFDNHFIPCTRDSGRDWGWAEIREGTILEEGGQREGQKPGKYVLYRCSNFIDHLSPACDHCPSQHLFTQMLGHPQARVSSPAPTHPPKLRAKVSRKLMAGPWGPVLSLRPETPAAAVW